MKTVDYRKLRRRFGLAFLISASLFVVFSLCALTLSSLSFRAPSPTHTLPGTPTPQRTPVPGTAVSTHEPSPTRTPVPALASQDFSLDTLTIAAALVGIVGTCLTSATTLGGFAITTVLSIRQERRHARVSELERKLQEVELEKQKLELERMRKEQRNRGEAEHKDDSA